VLAAFVALFALVSNPGTPTENLVAGAAVVPFLLWAWRPALVPTLALVVIVAAAQFAAQRSGDLEPLLFLVAIAAAIVGAWEPSRWAAVVAATLVVATPFVVEVVVDDDIAYGLWIVGILLPLLLGRVSRWQLRLAAELAEARQELARQAATEEKRRIARDVHDLVGHGLAAMLLHVTGARHVLRRDPDQADQAMADAEAVGRRSMEELRRTLHLLRAPQAEPVAEPPLPAAGDIAAAVETARAAGVHADFRLVGDLGRIDPIVGLSLHRVVEEALANARRHAPRAVTDVVLTVEPEGVVLTVDSVGPIADGKPEDPDRPCYGIVGMRERMGSIGGDLEAGPTATGWSVRCRAPLMSAGQDR
jgi:signal transduction histidine kinase